MHFLNMLNAASGHSWVGVALLIGFFWAALAHPDRIRSVTEFRLATWLLGGSMVAPVMIQLFIAGDGRPLDSPQVRVGQDVGTAMYLMAIPPLLNMVAVILGVDSVTPRSRAKGA